jgi:hypothetical protein
MRANDLKETLHLVAYYLFICLLKEVNIPFWGQAVDDFFHFFHLHVFLFQRLVWPKIQNLFHRSKVYYTFSSQTGLKSVLVTINADVPVIMHYEKNYKLLRNFFASVMQLIRDSKFFYYIC